MSPSSPPEKKGRAARRKRRWPWVLLALVLVAAVGVAASAIYARDHFYSPYQGYEGPRHQVAVEPGTGGAQILRQLENAGVLADARLARLYLVRVLGDPPLRAGEYSFEGAATGPEVLDKLIEGQVVTHKVTVIEGLTLEETAEHLAASNFGDYEAFLAAMRSPTLIADLDPRADDLEGYLFPDTYAFARGTSEDEIVSTLVRTFRKNWEAIQPLLAEGKTRGIRVSSPDEATNAIGNSRELITLASIIQKEAGATEELPLVAAVYANRLTRGIALYADPTVIFALKRRGTWDGNIRRADLQIDSPYNTYRYPGLPPGPIASPGLASMRAAAAPSDAPYLYFVSRNDGTHVFARTLSEHNANVNRWQRQYWRKRWAEERNAKASGEKRDS